jgi:hypothetical protein
MAHTTMQRQPHAALCCLCCLRAPRADFFATWCNGCQRSYPELCKVAMDPDMQKEVKFVKVGVRARARIAAGPACVSGQTPGAVCLHARRHTRTGVCHAHTTHAPRRPLQHPHAAHPPPVPSPSLPPHMQHTNHTNHTNHIPTRCASRS